MLTTLFYLNSNCRPIFFFFIFLNVANHDHACVDARQFDTLYKTYRGYVLLVINVKKTVVYTRVNGALHIENCKNYKKVITHQHIA